MTDILYSTEQVARMIGMSKSFVHQHRNKSMGLRPQFLTDHSVGNPTMLWTRAGVDNWIEFMHRRNGKVLSLPSNSPLLAVNVVEGKPSTWKLWWQTKPNGDTRWWFSTPRGWFYSDDDDGRHWMNALSMNLNPDYRYATVDPAKIERGSIIAAVLRHAGVLRRKVESDMQIEEKVGWERIV